MRIDFGQRRAAEIARANPQRARASAVRWAFVAKLISDKQLGSICQRVLRLLPRSFPSIRTLNWAIFPSAQRIVLCARPGAAGLCSRLSTTCPDWAVSFADRTKLNCNCMN